MSDLVERIHAERSMRAFDPQRPANPILLEAATALEAKEAEIAALRERVAHYDRWLKIEANVSRKFLARAETAERRVTELEEEKVRFYSGNPYSEHNKVLSEARIKAERERDEARAALKPFAQIGARWPETYENDNAEIVVTVASLRAAARAVIEE